MKFYEVICKIFKLNDPSKNLVNFFVNSLSNRFFYKSLKVLKNDIS